MNALQVVCLEQSGGRLPLHHGRELPAEIVHVLDAAIAAACAERRDDVRAVTREDHASMDEALEPSALEAVDRNPIHLEGPLADHRLDARDDPLRLALHFRIGIRSELQVDPVDVVGLLVQECRLAIVEGWLEPEPALGGELGSHLDVGDEKALLEHATDEAEAQAAAHRTADAVARHNIVG